MKKSGYFFVNHNIEIERNIDADLSTQVNTAVVLRNAYSYYCFVSLFPTFAGVIAPNNPAANCVKLMTIARPLPLEVASPSDSAIRKAAAVLPFTHIGWYYRRQLRYAYGHS